MTRNRDIAMKVWVGLGIWTGALATACGVFAQTPTPPTGSTQTAPTGQIQGTVQTTSGAPVVSAAVSINSRVAGAGAVYTPFNTRVPTSAGGAFNVSAVPNGIYAVCVNPPDQSTLPPCLWGGELQVIVANGRTVTIPTIQLQPSADLYVRVNDLKGNGAAATGKVPGASLILAVRTAGDTVIPVPVTASDSTGFDAHASVPPGKTFWLMVFSNYFSLTDSSGAPISKNSGLQMPILIPAETAQYKTVVNIN